jgi:23S rRNA pseudouridine2605 synthase
VIRRRFHNPTENPDASRKVGLARALSKLGYCSRQQAVELIRRGKVRLNGSTPNNPETPVRLGTDRIEVQGQRLKAAENIYLMLNKPRGFVTSASDEKGRDTVYSLLPSGLTWLAPVGRLDKASEGLLFFTNDSAWNARITNPATHLDKTYHVQIAAIADSSFIEKLQRGVETQRDDVLRCKRASLLRSGEKNSWLELTLDEGKNRHIRRMFDALVVEVLRLIRVSIGPVLLGDLAKGAYRPLTSVELTALDTDHHRHPGWPTSFD